MALITARGKLADLGDAQVLEDLRAAGGIDFDTWTSSALHKTWRNKTLEFDRHKYLAVLYSLPRLLEQGKIHSITQKKGTQAGATEWLVWFAITRAILGWSIFYVLPTYQMVGRFVRNRIDRSVNYTPFYGQAALEEEVAFKKARRRQSESMFLKHFGKGAIAFVGSNSSSGFTEFPADITVVDEWDECDPENLSMVPERYADSELQWDIRVGNPKAPATGISEAFDLSSKHRWTLRCPSGHPVVLDFFQHVVRDEGEGKFRVLDKEWDGLDSDHDALPICDRCGHPIDRRGEGEWVAESESALRAGRFGIHYSKLFTGRTSVNYLLGRLEAGTRKASEMSRLYNGDLGLEYMAPGSKITEEMIESCREDYLQAVPERGLNLIGVDVGNLFHLVVGQVRQYKEDDKLVERMKIVKIDAVPTLRELMQVIRDYHVVGGVMDALPEKRITRMVVGRHPGMFACFYVEGRLDVAQKGKVVGVDRTSALDQVKDAFLSRYYMVPRDWRTIPDLEKQLTISTRVWDEKANKKRGAWVWVSGDKPDHYHHAFAYLTIARNIAARIESKRGTRVAGAA